MKKYHILHGSGFKTLSKRMKANSTGNDVVHNFVNFLIHFLTCTQVQIWSDASNQWQFLMWMTWVCLITYCYDVVNKYVKKSKTFFIKVTCGSFKSIIIYVLIVDNFKFTIDMSIHLN